MPPTNHGQILSTNTINNSHPQNIPTLFNTNTSSYTSYPCTTTFCLATNTNETSSVFTCTELNHHRGNAITALTNASADSTALLISKQNNILSVLLLIGHVFDLILCESGGFGNEIIDSNSEFELEKSGLTNCDFDVLPSPTNNTISVSHTQPFNFGATGVGLAECIKVVFDLSAALTGTTIITTIGNKNEIKRKHKRGQNEMHTNEQRAHPEASPTDLMIEIDSTGVGSHEFNINESIFDGDIYGIGFDNGTTLRASIEPGKMVNGFDKDTESIGDELSTSFTTLKSNILAIVGAIALSSSSAPILLTLLAMSDHFLYIIKQCLCPSSREPERLETISRSPVYAR